MFTVEEICEEQERQYNQLMQEDDQYCHPESFKWGFEHGVEYALTKLGWHPASELPPVDRNGNSKSMVVIDDNGLPNYAYFHSDNLAKFWVKADVRGMQSPILSVKWWSYPPKED